MIENEALDQALDTITANGTATLAYIDENIEMLVKAAKEVQDQYMDRFTSTSGRNGNKLGSRIPSVRSRLVAGATSLEIRWSRLRGSGDQRQQQSYPKGKNHSYSVSRITQNAPEWEVTLVTEAEERFAKIRSTYAKLTKIRRLCKTIDKDISSYYEESDS